MTKSYSIQRLIIFFIYTCVKTVVPGWLQTIHFYLERINVSYNFFLYLQSRLFESPRGIEKPPIRHYPRKDEIIFG